MRTLGALVAAHAGTTGERLAYLGGDQRLTWGEYHERADALARALVDAGVQPGDRVAVWLPDGPAVHVCYVAVERAGGVIVGIGPRAGRREVDHLLAATGASWLLAPPGTDVGPDVVTVPITETARPSGEGTLDGRARDVDDLWLLNSTSGTTGLPKCVMHHQRRWFAFHELAVEAGALSGDDVFLSALPAPFGFGIWTAHVTPTVLGAPCIVLPGFDASECLALIEREHVSVLAAVSTQFIMLLNSPAVADHDLSSLRVLFTGGEMVPERRAAEFEDRTGCRVLQFYGSNETGALSRTTVADSRARRLRTAGAVIPEMHVRLLDGDGADVTASGGPGVAACRGPLTCLGYYDDPVANAALYTTEGWMLTGDRCTIDPDGYLRVAGRTSDFIIRGGKNISAAQVEDEVSTHEAVALAAAVAMPDPVFGERVCVYAELRPRRGAAPTRRRARPPRGPRGREGALARTARDRRRPPRASGGKVAKGALRDDIARRVADRSAP